MSSLQLLEAPAFASGHGEVVNTWVKALEMIPPQAYDVYYDEGYSALYASESVSPRAFVFTQADDAYLVPYLEHRNPYLGGERFDVATPYGYGGPIASTADSAFLSAASEAFYEAMCERGAVSGFVRCHPLLGTHERLGDRWDVRFDRPTVGADLTLDVDDMWGGQLDAKARNRIRKAEAVGLELVVDEKLELLDEFIEVYYHSMDAVAASPFYYFSRAYFERFKTDLAPYSTLVVARLNGRVIAGMLFLCDGKYAHAHLSGSLTEHRDIAPNNFVIFRSMLVMKERGCRVLHLGGGATSDPGDSLLRFKRRFSKQRLEFHVASTVFDQAAFGRAVDAWHQDGGVNDGGRFPPYGLLGRE